MTNLIGQNLGSYRLLATLGEGGLTRVYKAFQPSLERVVAIKVLTAYFWQDDDFPARFQREAEVAARLDHPHILPVYDFGQDGRVIYLVVRYVEGLSLRETLRQHPSLSQIGEWLGQVAAALDYAHQQGVFHCALSPSSILLEGGQHALVSDFGLAQIFSNAVSAAPLSIGSGSPAYLSPEQIEGRPLDARTDIYTLGVILYELVTGHVPFQDESPLAVALKHLTAPLPLPCALNPALPPGIEPVILRALAKNLADRYPSAGEMMAAFNRVVSAASQPPRPAPLLSPDLGSTCPTCRHVNRTGISFCEYCATPLRAKGLICTHCGYSNRTGLTFCEQCATPLNRHGSLCSSCGFRNRPGVKFCERCAAPLAVMNRENETRRNL